MSADIIQLREVSDKSIAFWLRKAKAEGLTAIQAACLAYDFEPPKAAVSLWQLPACVEDFAQILEEKYQPASWMDEKRDNTARLYEEIGAFYIGIEDEYSFETIKKAMQEYEFSFIPKLLLFENNQNKDKLLVKVGRDAELDRIESALLDGKVPISPKELPRMILAFLDELAIQGIDKDNIQNKKEALKKCLPRMKEEFPEMDIFYLEKTVYEKASRADILASRYKKRGRKKGKR